jgi:hypothetical protein
VRQAYHHANSLTQGSRHRDGMPPCGRAGRRREAGRIAAGREHKEPAQREKRYSPAICPSCECKERLRNGCAAGHGRDLQTVRRATGKLHGTRVISGNEPRVVPVRLGPALATVAVQAKMMAAGTNLPSVVPFFIAASQFSARGIYLAHFGQRDIGPELLTEYLRTAFPGFLRS